MGNGVKAVACANPCHVVCQHVEEDLHKCIEDMVQQITDTYAGLCRGAIAVIDTYGTGALWADAMSEILSLPCAMQDCGCCEEYTKPLDALHSDMRSTFLAKFFSNTLEEIRGINFLDAHCGCGRYSLLPPNTPLRGLLWRNRTWTCETELYTRYGFGISTTSLLMY